MRDLIKRYPLISFFLFSYAFSWAYWVPLLINGLRVAPGSSTTHFPGLLGPAVAACIVETACRGKMGLALLLRRLILVSRPQRVFWAYSLTPLGFLGAALLVLYLRGVPIPGVPDFARFSGLPELGLPIVVLLVFLIGGYGEELGWRGFALEQMQRRFGPTGGALLLAVLWAGWHLPTFGVIQTYHQMTLPMILGGFLLGIVSGSLVLARVANKTGGSVLSVAIWHTAYNLTSATSAGNGFVAAFTSSCVMLWAVLLLAGERRRVRGRSLLSVAVASQQALTQKHPSAISGEIVTEQIANYLKREGPGLQYVAVNNRSVIFEYVGGLADIKRHTTVNRNTTMSAFSMTKIITALSVLQLEEARKIHLDDKASLYIEHPFDQSITIKQLLNHTSGIPNPIPLGWVHSVEQHQSFDEDMALKKVYAKNYKQKHPPGKKYLYSNIGYWLLGKTIERVTKQEYSKYVKLNILDPLRITPKEIDFVIVGPDNHAKGYLAKFSFMNFLRGFLLDKSVWGEYEGNWLHIHDVYLDGPSFGGAIGTASAFSRVLQDLLNDNSLLLSKRTKELLFQQTRTSAGQNIDMTLGWHIGELAGLKYYYKEGGGAGFHCEMRIYPDKGIGTVVMANQTGLNTNRFLSKLDVELME